MGYHPETLVCSFPPYPRGGHRMRDGSISGRRGPGNLLYALKPWIGFDLWHIDPERPGTGNRTDDSCGWFDRTPGDYADAVAYVLKDETFMHDVRLSVARSEPTPYPFYEGISERQLTGLRLPAGEALALVLMVANELELRRWWNGQNGRRGACESFAARLFNRKRDVVSEVVGLALHPLDNLSHVEEAERIVHLIAATLNRRFRPWWKHPRWHVHHWQVQFDLVRNLKRMFQRCDSCGKALGYGYCPTVSGDRTYHGDCYGMAAMKPAEGVR